MLEQLPIAKIITGHTQFRAAENVATVDAYAEAMEAGEIFPPIVVWRVDGELHLSDGYHRLAALRRLKRECVEADVREGTALELFEHALGANAQHGLPRTQEDKRKAVRAALAHPELSRRSDKQIAKLCLVSQPFVSGLRKALRKDDTIPKTAKAIGEVLDLPLLERWERTLPYTDKRRAAVTAQKTLVQDCAWGTRMTHQGLKNGFPRLNAAPRDWIVSGDTVFGGAIPAVFKLWLQWVETHPKPSGLDAETWLSTGRASTDPEELWNLAADPGYLRSVVKTWLIAGAQILWVQANRWSWTFDTFTPATPGVRAVCQQILDEEEQRRQSYARPAAPEPTEEDVESWSAQRIRETGRISWDAQLRARCWERAQVLELPLTACAAPICAQPTPAEVPLCLRCGVDQIQARRTHRFYWQNLLLWHRDTASPLWPLLRGLLNGGDPWSVDPLDKRRARQALAEGVLGLADLTLPEPKGEEEEEGDDDDDASEDEGLDDDGGADD